MGLVGRKKNLEERKMLIFWRQRERTKSDAHWNLSFG